MTKPTGLGESAKGSQPFRTSHLSVRARIVLAFSFTVLAFASVAVVSARQFRSHRADMADAQAAAAAASSLESVQIGILTQNLQLEIVLANGDDEVASQIRESSGQLETQIQTFLDNAREANDDGQIEALTEVQTGVGSLLALSDTILRDEEAGDVAAASAAMGTYIALLPNVDSILGEAISEERAAMMQARMHANGTASFAFWLLVISSGVGVVFGIVLSALIARSIIKPLSSLERAAKAISSGDTTARARASGAPPELRRLGSALDGMADSLLHLARHDPLTGLPNRLLLDDRTAQALAQARRTRSELAIMFLDLDRFKIVNDTLGHEGGDRLLKEVGDRLTKLVREGDTVSRVGGDEFALLLPNIHETDGVIAVGERVLQALAEPHFIAGREFHVPVSIGVAVWPDDGDDTQTLLEHADTAMYRAKEEGGNRYQAHTPEMQTLIQRQVVLEASMRKALKNGEFVVYYQPQMDLETEHIVGMEALVRWDDPAGGIILPGEFIPLLEDSGMIVELGEWVLREACKQMKTWQEASVAFLPVSVNLSPRQLRQRGLIDMITGILDETGLEPRYLDIEITESITMQEDYETIETLRKLRETGISVSIDDFGTGYSSLAYLRKYPVDTIKIDKVFVDDIKNSHEEAPLVTAILAMARSLDLKVVAEGVETAEQQLYLKDRQCGTMQGYLLSKAVPAEELGEMLKRDSRPSGAREILRPNR